MHDCKKCANSFVGTAIAVCTIQLDPRTCGNKFKPINKAAITRKNNKIEKAIALRTGAVVKSAARVNIKMDNYDTYIYTLINKCNGCTDRNNGVADPQSNCVKKCQLYQQVKQMLVIK